MTRDEMKDRISMALKDPTLQQGFEIICKENAELKKQLENLQAMLQAEREVRCNTEYLKKVIELEKENEQLNFALLSKPKSPTVIIVDDIDTAVKIAKARKIIEELYDIIPASMADYAKEPMERARKFIKEF